MAGYFLQGTQLLLYSESFESTNWLIYENKLRNHEVKINFLGIQQRKYPKDLGHGIMSQWIFTYDLFPVFTKSSGVFTGHVLYQGLIHAQVEQNSWSR